MFSLCCKKIGVKMKKYKNIKYYEYEKHTNI